MTCRLEAGHVQGCRNASRGAEGRVSADGHASLAAAERVPAGGHGLRVVELFAGVGGFRLGLERAGDFRTVWFNQWEPSTKAQWAHNLYVRHWPTDIPNTNVDIAQVKAEDVPDHDLLVGGFPCQDYSIAATLASSQGIEGKKGVLWWDVRRIIEAKRPRHVKLENVDRLLSSPASQRGRDFGIILRCFADLGYAVEWRVVNAADYGAAQRRRRTFIYATTETALVQAIGDCPCQSPVLAKAFPGDAGPIADEFPLPATVGEAMRWGAKFHEAGSMVGGVVRTYKVQPAKAPARNLSTVVTSCMTSGRFLTIEAIEGPRGWRYVKGKKDEKRETRGGYGYRYKEGAIPFPDDMNKPARTMLTDEGGLSPGRSRHVVVDPGTGQLRTLQPEEAEALNGFPAGWTAGAPDRWRFFLMGNALVVDMVERMGRALLDTLAKRVDVAGRLMEVAVDV